MEGRPTDHEHAGRSRLDAAQCLVARQVVQKHCYLMPAAAAAAAAAAAIAGGGW